MLKYFSYGVEGRTGVVAAGTQPQSEIIIRWPPRQRRELRRPTGNMLQACKSMPGWRVARLLYDKSALVFIPINHIQSYDFLFNGAVLCCGISLPVDDRRPCVCSPVVQEWGSSLLHCFSSCGCILVVSGVFFPISLTWGLRCYLSSLRKSSLTFTMFDMKFASRGRRGRRIHGGRGGYSEREGPSRPMMEPREAASTFLQETLEEIQRKLQQAKEIVHVHHNSDALTTRFVHDYLIQVPVEPVIPNTPKRWIYTSRKHCLPRSWMTASTIH